MPWKGLHVSDEYSPTDAIEEKTYRQLFIKIIVYSNRNKTLNALQALNFVSMVGIHKRVLRTFLVLFRNRNETSVTVMRRRMPCEH